jgi:predicted Zn-dependent peptidase
MYEQQIVSEVGVFPDKRENMSLLTFYAIANTPETTAETLQQKLLEEIEKLGTVDTIKNRIDATKNQIKMGLANNLISGHGLSEAAALNATFFNDPNRMFETMERYQKIDVEQILNFFNKYIHKQAYITTMVKKK